VLFTGFPWNPLGAALYRNIALIQCSAVGGVYLVSALIVLINFSAGLTVLRYIEHQGKWGRRPHPELMLGFLIITVVMTGGWRKVTRPESALMDSLRVALIQPNIPQDDKWSGEKLDFIYQQLELNTLAAVRYGKPDLVVWPETAVPDEVRYSERSYAFVRMLATNGVPILVGTMDAAVQDGGEPLYYNSSFLFDGRGGIAKVYDKRHLVMFGEYVPLQKWLPFFKALTPIQESFSAGSTSTVFSLGNSDIPFSALICFEDTLAHLARESVRNGARFLINQTNDAWFDPSAASRQHMAHCVFRCVENRVPAVRVANTGISCYIDYRGVVRAELQDDKGNHRLAGFKVVDVEVPPVGAAPTFYTRHGDVFGSLSMATMIPLFMAVRYLKRREITG
jgi:apolipoprotein N-acyltransferase